jgi:phospholipid-binding lipoprotein MlaA
LLLLSGWGGALVATVGALQAHDNYLTEEELYGDFEQEPMVVSDPLEPMNRVTFKFNDIVYTHVVSHIANGYQMITPDPVERGASNFFKNLGYPVRLVGNLLQGRVKGAWRETERFAVNTTLGVAGFWVAADRFECMPAIAPEDIGQAFGAWGIGSGPYLVIPLLGPSNVRDFVGYIGDRAVNPLQQPYSVIEDSKTQLAIGVTEFVVKSPSLMELYTQMKGGAFDPYSSMKNAYSQKRESLIAE